MNRTIETLARSVISSAASSGLRIAAAESCTGGLIGGALTDVPGSSAVFDRGFITYTNTAKSELLGVPSEMIEMRGAVSAEVAAAMAAGAYLESDADIAVAVTGIAGPTGGSTEKPVGTVWFAIAREGEALKVERRLFSGGSRRYVRLKTVETALRLLSAAI